MKNIFLILSMCIPFILYSGNFQVNSLGDGGDNNAGNGICNDGTGNCTLRAAIEEANALGNCYIEIQVTGTIVLGSMLPPLNANMTIQGPGSDMLTISGGNTVRIFYAKNGNIVINDVTLANGMALGGSGGDGGGGGMGAGGALLMHEGQTGTLDVQVNNVVFDNNQAFGGNGSSGENGGGGGLGGDGGAADTDSGGGGGGGFLGNGGDANDENGGGGGGFFLAGEDSDDSGDGGDGGGGGADGGDGGDNPFAGEDNGEDANDPDGGDGGFGGGGGGGQYEGNGGDGGFGGGGGSGGFVEGDGGDGGFGGGGGSGVDDGGDGGFGGGGGAADNDAGVGGMGAGDGDNVGNGGGGLGAGGAVFVVSGTLTLANVLFSNNMTGQSTGGDTDNGGESLAGAIFVYNGEPIDGKMNAQVFVEPGCGLTFVNNTALDDEGLLYVGDGSMTNDNDDVYGMITGMIGPDNPACYTLIIIPTLGQWGLFVLILFLLNVSFSAILSRSAKMATNRGNLTVSMVTAPIGSYFRFIPPGEWKLHLKELLATMTILFAVIFLLWGHITGLDVLLVVIVAPLLVNLMYLAKESLKTK